MFMILCILGAPLHHQIPPNTTQPLSTPAFPFNVMAFPFIVMAFPVSGRSQKLGVPIWSCGGARPWPSGAGDEGRGAALGGPGMGAPRHFLRPQRHLAMAWHRRQAWHHSNNRERHEMNWERHNIKWKHRGGVWWGGGGWGRGGFELKLRTSGRGSNRRPP